LACKKFRFLSYPLFSGFRVSEAGVQVVIDGKREKTKYGLLSMPVFSEDGRHYACTGGSFAGPAARKIGKVVFVADGREMTMALAAL
jgi:hypothetical protein